MHALRFTLHENQDLKSRQVNRDYVSVSSTINGRSWCPIITVYSGNCVTMRSWTEIILTSTKAHLKINNTTNVTLRFSLQHFQILPY